MFSVLDLFLFSFASPLSENTFLFLMSLWFSGQRIYICIGDTQGESEKEKWDEKKRDKDKAKRVYFTWPKAADGDLMPF